MNTKDEQAEQRLQHLIDRLPNWLSRLVHRVRKPSARWVRIPLALLCIAGGVLAILPVFGLWMLPLGIVLLVEDVPFLRRGVYGTVNWLAERRPHWFA